MAKSGIKKKDLSNIMDYVSALGDNAVSALKSEVYEDAVQVFNQSQEEVPVLSGDLRSSGRLFVNEGKDSSHIEISYDEDHAMIVHENPKQNKFKHGKRSHYLVRPFGQMFRRPGYEEDLSERVFNRASSGKRKTQSRDLKGKPGPLADRTKSRYQR